MTALVLLPPGAHTTAVAHADATSVTSGTSQVGPGAREALPECPGPVTVVTRPRTWSTRWSTCPGPGSPRAPAARSWSWAGPAGAVALSGGRLRVQGARTRRSPTATGPTTTARATPDNNDGFGQNSVRHRPERAGLPQQRGGGGHRRRRRRQPGHGGLHGEPGADPGLRRRPSVLDRRRARTTAATPLGCSPRRPRDCATTDADVGPCPAEASRRDLSGSGDFQYNSTGGEQCAWKYRTVIPISFAPVPASCAASATGVAAEGMPMLDRALTQWVVGSCLAGNNPVTVNAPATI